jgi:hypothetical protein
MIRQKIVITVVNGDARRAVAERHITRALRLTSFAKMLRTSQSPETVYAKIVEIKVKDA